MMKRLLSTLFLILLNCTAQALPLLKGTDLTHGTAFEHNWNGNNNPTVVVFLSSSCPCSMAHIDHLITLAKDFPQVKFIGVHSNANESQEEAQKYFQSLDLPFPVIQDNSSEWADRLKAYRTPHAFLISPSGEILYQGGVTSSADPKKADAFYLKVTLKNILSGKKIENTHTRVLGCQIARE